jgi:hypothetical protein
MFFRWFGAKNLDWRILVDFSGLIVYYINYSRCHISACFEQHPHLRNDVFHTSVAQYLDGPRPRCVCFKDTLRQSNMASWKITHKLRF